MVKDSSSICLFQQINIITRLRRTRAESSPRTPKSAESESRERQEAFVGGFSMLLDVSNRIRTKISVKIAQISLERKIPLRSLKNVTQADLCWSGILLWFISQEICSDHPRNSFHASKHLPKANSAFVDRKSVHWAQRNNSLRFVTHQIQKQCCLE